MFLRYCQNRYVFRFRLNEFSDVLLSRRADDESSNTLLSIDYTTTIINVTVNGSRTSKENDLIKSFSLFVLLPFMMN